MRIIAGSLKGRRLQAPTWPGLRPTSDKLRETLFNVLAPRIAGARVVDAFAGTGALGLEAISRGAAFVAFIERDRRAQTLIAANLAHCGIAEGYAIIRAPVARGFDLLTASPTFVPFDIVLLDPPYGDPVGEVLAGAAVMVSAGGLVVLEHARRESAPETAGGLVRVRSLSSGDSALTLYSVPMSG